MISDPHFIRYRAMMSQLASGALASAMQANASRRAAELFTALPAAALLLRDDPALHEALAQAMELLTGIATLADPAGHERDIYHPFAMHLCLSAFQRRKASMSPPLRNRCEGVVNQNMRDARLFERFNDGKPLRQVSTVLWNFLILAQQAALLARGDVLTHVDSFVSLIAATPGHHGSLHEVTEDDSLDTWTYRELVGLHALSRLALLRRRSDWMTRVKEVSLFHVENTQPDNATNEPWAVSAFLISESTRSFADQQLHDATTQGGGRLQLLPALLLADAADFLAEFTSSTPGQV